MKEFFQHYLLCPGSLFSLLLCSWTNDLAVNQNPGLLSKQGGQQGGGGDSPPVLLSAEAPPGAPCPALGPPAQERHGCVGAGPEEDHRNDGRDGTPLL